MVGPVGLDHWPIPTFSHFREKLTATTVLWMLSSSSIISIPLACPEWSPQTEETQVTLADSVSVDAVFASPSALLVTTSYLRKRAGKSCSIPQMM